MRRSAVPEPGPSTSARTIKVAVLTGSVSRQGGGVFEAVAGLSRAMQAMPGLEVRVFGLRDDGTDAAAPSWGGVPVVAGAVRGPPAFGYSAAYGAGLAAFRPDIVHVHGLWMYASVAALWWAARTRTACVISPHGMLDRWALDNAAFKKRIAGMLYQDRHFRRAACLHAVGGAELEAMRTFGLRNPVCVIPNGVAPAPTRVPASASAWRVQLPSGARVLLYLGRLHPKKGLPNLLDAWAACATPPHHWHLVIAGWDDRGHRAELEAQAAALGLMDTVHFIGPQFGADKDAAFADADAFVLPSHSEGLPIAVLEAWSHGLPVLMTGHCNLPQGFEAGAALPIEPTAAGITPGLRRLIGMATAERARMGDAGRQLAGERFGWAHLAGSMTSVYRWLLFDEPAPSCLSMGAPGIHRGSVH